MHIEGTADVPVLVTGICSSGSGHTCVFVLCKQQDKVWSLFICSVKQSVIGSSCCYQQY